MVENIKRRYIFIGRDGSMGLRRYKSYTLYIDVVQGGRIVAKRKFLGVTFWSCPYTSTETFDKNWSL